MAIESVIELKVVGLDELEARLKALNEMTIRFGGGSNAPSSPEEKEAKEKEKAEKKQAKDEATKKKDEDKKALAAQKEFTKQQDILRRKQEDFSKSIGKLTMDMSKFSANLVLDTGKKLGGAFLSLTKSIVGAGGLLASIGSVISLAGLIRASQDISRRTFQATGYGIMNPNVIGRLQATYGKFSDVSGGLAALTEGAYNPASITMGALSNVMSRVGMNVSAPELRSMESEKRYQMVSEALFKASKNQQLFEMLSNPILVERMGLEGLAGPEIMQRYRSYSQGQFNELRGIGESRRGILEMPTETRFAYERFGAQRETGMAAMENQLLIAMQPVLEPINRVFTAVATNLMKGSGAFKDFIEGLTEDINMLAEAISTGKWEALFANIQKQIQPFAESAWKWIQNRAGEAWDHIVQAFLDKFKPLSEWIDKITNSEFYKLISKVAEIGFTLLEWNAKLGLGALEAGAKGVNDYVTPAIEKAAGVANVAGGKISSAAGSAWDYAKKVAKDLGLDESIFTSMLFQESGGNTKAISKKGAMGFGQLMPGTAKMYGVTDPLDPYQNILASGKYLKQNLEDFGSYDLALAAYNAGPGRVKQYGNQIPPFQETRNYVSNIMNSARKSAFRNGSLPSASYMPSGMTGGTTGMSPVFTIRNYNNPENSASWSFSSQFGQLNTDNPNY